MTSNANFARTMRRLAMGLGCAAVVIVLASCITNHQGQDRLRGFPYQVLRSPVNQTTDPRKIITYAAPGLSASSSGDLSFPDLYVFIDRNQGDKFFDAFVTQLLGPSLSSNGIGSIDPKLVKKVRQVLAYKPLRGAALQAILIGDFPYELTRAAILGSGQWKQRIIKSSDSQQLYVFDNILSPIHLGLTVGGFLIVQSDLATNGIPMPGSINKEAQAVFEVQVQRLYSYLKGNFVPVLQLINDRKSAYALATDPTGLSNSDPEGGSASLPALVVSTDSPSFDQVLADEWDRDAIFAFVSVGLPPGLPIGGLRIRIEPIAGVKDETGVKGPSYFDLQIAISPRLQDSLKSLKTSIKLGLLAVANAAGLDPSFADSVQLTEVKDKLVISGIKIPEASAGQILGAFVSQANAIAAPGTLDSAQ